MLRYQLKYAPAAPADAHFTGYFSIKFNRQHAVKEMILNLNLNLNAKIDMTGGDDNETSKVIMVSCDCSAVPIILRCRLQ